MKNKNMPDRYWIIFRWIIYYIGLSMLIIDFDMEPQWLIKVMGSVVLGIAMFTISLNDKEIIEDIGIKQKLLFKSTEFKPLLTSKQYKVYTKHIDFVIKSKEEE